MAQQDTGVARTAFISALLGSDSAAPAISREDATLFTTTLLKASNLCTNANIKLCKSFVVKYVLDSSQRTAALAKYLVQLSRSFAPRDLEARVDTTKPGDENEGLGKIVNGKVQQPPDPAYKRLHLLFIIHDVLSYLKSHPARHTPGAQAGVSAESLDVLQPSVSTLAELAACGKGGAVNTRDAVLDLLAFWWASQVFSAAQLDRMHEKVLLADSSEWSSLLLRLSSNGESNPREQTSLLEGGSKWTLPDRHGVIDDPVAPWHELPAANGLYIKRTRGYPIRSSAIPQGGFRLRDGGREADAQLKKDVSNLYSEVIRCYDKYTNADDVQDVDALGNIIWKDPERPTRNYWGFSIDGIDRRKELAERFAETANGYDDFGQPYGSGGGVNSAVERARALAAARGRAMGRGRGVGRADWLEGQRW